MSWTLKQQVMKVTVIMTVSQVVPRIYTVRPERDFRMDSFFIFRNTPHSPFLNTVQQRTEQKGRRKMSNVYRSKTMNQVSESDIGTEVKLAGWVENIRDHGGVSFVDLRDMYGVVQVVFRNTDLFKGIRKEQCLSVEGVITERDEETYNPKIATGTIELEVHKVEILGKVYRDLPLKSQPRKKSGRMSG